MAHQLESVQIEQLSPQFTGELLRQGDSGYDDARQVWNGMYDRHPALIARCKNVDDVVAAVNFARDNELLLAVRGGGHSAVGYGVCDDGLVIDLAEINQVDVDPDDAHRARRRRHHLGPVRHGNPGARPRRDRRPLLHHRHRRAHARQR